MSYTALYRKFRPQGFDDVKGQEPIVTTLKNQIRAGRIGHAYLFCGTRGTGKTTVAKIFAKAVNCENPADGSPCGECALCKAIASGASMNVIEIDAASNNGVDNIREIVDEVSYSPAEGKYKVYIIDEVHMLSTGAFNALLKTLEEPPAYVIFILATTEAHKIPVTVLSRCQRYDFKRIRIDTITDRMQDLMKEEKVAVEERALTYIARAADGSMRDALSLLDQCIAFHFGQELTYDKVLDVLGAVDTEVFARLFDRILTRDVTGSVGLLEEVVMQGRELSQFVTDFTWYLRNLLLAVSSEDIEEALDISSENMERLKAQAKKADPDMLIRYIHIFSELSGRLRYASQKRILIEVALIRLCRPAMDTDRESVLERVRELEEKLAKGVTVAAYGTDGNMPSQTGSSLEKESASTAPQLPKAVPEDVRKAVEQWGATISRMGQPMKTYLKEARLSLAEDGKLLIVVQDGPASDYLAESGDNRELLRRMISDSVGKEVEIRIQSIADNESFDSSYVDLSRIIHMDIEIEEE